MIKKYCVYYTARDQSLQTRVVFVPLQSSARIMQALLRLIGRPIQRYEEIE